MAACPDGVLASGYEFDGIGARAIARGGAVIADAADWTAIYWNPADLVLVRQKEAGLEAKSGFSYTKDGNSFNTGVAGNTFNKKRSVSSFLFGSVGAAIPLNPDSALGVGFYMPLLQGSRFTDWNEQNTLYHSLDYKSFAGIMVWNVSYSMKMTEKAAVGAGLDVIRGDLRTDVKADLSMPPSLALMARLGLAPAKLTKKTEAAGYGMEGVFGWHYQLSDALSLGAVARTGSKVKLKGDSTASYAGVEEKSDMVFRLKQPPTSGVGAAWQAKKDLRLTCDLTQTYWRGFSNSLRYDKPGELLADQENTYKWKNSYKFRAGALWAYGERTDFMFGYAFDTPAIDKESIDFSSAIDVPMHRFTAGASRRWGPVEGTFTVLAGSGSRTTGGIHYRLSGVYGVGEVRYSF